MSIMACVRPVFLNYWDDALIQVGKMYEARGGLRGWGHFADRDYLIAYADGLCHSPRGAYATKAPTLTLLK